MRGRAQGTPTRLIRFRWGDGAVLRVRSLAVSSPHCDLLLRVFGERRHPKPWLDKLRRVKADVARAMGWVPADANDARAVQAFKGRGHRTDLVRAVPMIEYWERSAKLKFRVEGCCAWVDYLRLRGIRSEAALERDLQKHGIEWTSPSLAGVLRVIGPDLELPEAAYRRARNRIGRAALVALLQPGCPDPKDYLRKLSGRGRRWPRRRIELSPEAITALDAFAEFAERRVAAELGTVV
jgi:hypothetical protein